MTWVANFDESQASVLVKVRGMLQAGPLREMTREVRDLVLQHQCKRVLIDYTEAVSKLEPYETFERPRVLQELGFPNDVRVAVLYRALDENTQFLENVYRNKNFLVRVFADPALALAWLEGQGP